jgi:hypothetical protein
LQTLAFAGGGNRCWWQAGLLTHLQAQGAQLQAKLVGTSAGAAIAASFLAGCVAAGTLAYLVDKYLFHNIHPVLPRFLGLKQAFFTAGLLLGPRSPTHTSSCCGCTALHVRCSSVNPQHPTVSKIAKTATRSFDHRRLFRR